MNVLDHNIINTFIQVLFGTIEMYLKLFWCLIKNYNKNNCTNTTTKLCVKMTACAVLSCLVGVSIVYSSSSIFAPYSSETDLLYTFFVKFLRHYYNYIRNVTTEDSSVSFTTNTDVYGAGEKIGVSTFGRRISISDATVMVSMAIHCIIGFNIVPIAMNQTNYKNLYHFVTWFILIFNYIIKVQTKFGVII